MAARDWDGRDRMASKRGVSVWNGSIKLGQGGGAAFDFIDRQKRVAGEPSVTRT